MKITYTRHTDSIVPMENYLDKFDKVIYKEKRVIKRSVKIFKNIYKAIQGYI